MNENIKQDYFKLIRDLNRSNITTNEKTEIYFFIEGTRFFAALSKSQKFFICEKLGDIWRANNNAEYLALKVHIAHFLNKSQAITDLTQQIKLSIFQVLY